MPKPPIPDQYAGLPVVTAQRMRELDAEATKKHGIPAETLMENAGRAVAREALAWLGRPGAFVVCCGRGANGGDGLVAARALREAGCSVTVFLCPAKRDAPYPALVLSNLDKARAAGVEVVEAGEGAGLAAALEAADAAIDALLGTGSAGKPAGAIHHMIQELTRSKKPVLAVDIPSGLQPDTGYHSGAVVTAAVTYTLGLPKRGLVAAPAKRYVGELKVLDIGYPKELLHA